MRVATSESLFVAIALWLSLPVLSSEAPVTSRLGRRNACSQGLLLEGARRCSWLAFTLRGGGRIDAKLVWERPWMGNDASLQELLHIFRFSERLDADNSTRSVACCLLCHTRIVVDRKVHGEMLKEWKGLRWRYCVKVAHDIDARAPCTHDNRLLVYAKH
jgi:hypothetical protein